MYWESNSDNDVTRFFPACGYIKADEQEQHLRGSSGDYWSSSSADNNTSYYFYFYKGRSYLDSYTIRARQPVRVFLD